MISAVISFALRLVLTVAGFFLVLALMAVALLTLIGVVIWSLVRGRRPTIDVSGFARARGKFNPGRPRQAMGEVVDIEAREVPEMPRAAPRLDP